MWCPCCGNELLSDPRTRHVVRCDGFVATNRVDYRCGACEMWVLWDLGPLVPVCLKEFGESRLGPEKVID